MLVLLKFGKFILLIIVGVVFVIGFIWVDVGCGEERKGSYCLC